MFKLYCNKNDAYFQETAVLTSGRVGEQISFTFSPDWDGLLKTAVFIAGKESRDVVLTEDNCNIPPEVLVCPGEHLRVGVFGETADKTLAIPTIYASAGTIRPGASPSGVPSTPPTPSWPEQVQAIATEAKIVADSVRSDADAGKFNGPAGEAGGWYTPAVTQPDANTMRLSFTPSKEGMPAVEPTDVVLPGGSSGGSITVDDTLTVSGAAADAKAVGDKINSLSEEIENVSGPTDEQVSSAVGGWLTEHPEATTTVQDGSITEEKLSESLIASIKEAGTATPTPFKIQEIGELYDHPLSYTAWCSGALHFDSELGKYVDLLYCAPKHENPDYTENYITYIDPKTYEATDPVLCKYYDTDGVTELTIIAAGRPAFVILQDGSYMILQTISKVNYRFISNDHGLTWVKGEAVSGFSDSTENYALVQLSNGRILANAISRVINYSDDDGITWTSVTPTTAGNSYEAEYFFLEVKPGVVMGICRMTVGGNGRTASGDCEHAVITVSEDYGTTWADLKVSDTIDNMNASTCTGCVHDGIVEIFAASRWYNNGDYAVTDYTNTGKSGAITHYVATIDNALADKFTKLGVIVYAKTTSNASTLAAQDFHTPCMAVNGSDMLMVYFDRVAPYDVADQVNHYYIRGSLSGIDYGVRDDLVSTIFPVSSAKVNALIKKLKNELIVKINEAILSGEIIPPEENEEGNPGTYIMDGIIANFNFTDSTVIDSEAMTVTDSIHKVTAMCTSDTFPEIRENSLANAAFTIPSLGEHCTTLDNGFTIEICVYHYDSDTFNELQFWGIPTASSINTKYFASGKYTRVTQLTYIDTDGVNQQFKAYAQWFGGASTTGFGFYHCVIVANIDGTVNLYKNGELIETLNPTNFKEWTPGFESNTTGLEECLKTYRVYNRALTADEVAINYKYEEATIV